MAGKMAEVRDGRALREALSRDHVRNSGFLWRVFGNGERYRVYAPESLAAAMAVQDTGAHVLFAGDWSGTEMPLALLPAEGFFVSASPPDAVESLKRHYSLEGEWPCWHFLAPPGYGPGEWDGLGPLTEGDVPFVASHWELGGEDREEHVRDSVRRFDSACLRLGGKPVSWCGLHFEFAGVGNLGFAHTLEQHRRKGYQRLVTKALVNRLAAKGARATADVIKDNAASISSCRTLGFEAVGELVWADFKKRDIL